MKEVIKWATVHTKVIGFVVWSLEFIQTLVSQGCKGSKLNFCCLAL